VLAACEKSPTDAVRINYDPRNPFDICSITFSPIYKGSKYAEDPYTGEAHSLPPHMYLSCSNLRNWS
jgi:hypothetical protein